MKRLIGCLCLLLLITSCTKPKEQLPSPVNAFVDNYELVIDYDNGKRTKIEINDEMEESYFLTFLKFNDYQDTFKMWVNENKKPVEVKIKKITLEDSYLSIEYSDNTVKKTDIDRLNCYDLYQKYHEYLPFANADEFYDHYFVELDDDLDYEYSLVDNHYQITKYLGTSDEITLPKYYQGKRVTMIKEAAFSKSNVKKVTIPFTYQEIGPKAFYLCTKLEEVEFLGDDCKLDLEVFSLCLNLQKVYLPVKIKNISSGLFKDCKNLNFINSSDLKFIEVIEPKAFYNCTSLNDFIFSTTLKSIGDEAFYGCSSLLRLNIFYEVETIGDSAFFGCSKLSSFSFGENVKSIGSSAFASCVSLENLEFSDNIESMGGYAFDNCTSLKKITLPPSLRNVGSSLFNNCTNLTDVVINEGLESLSSSMFVNCYRLVNVHFSSTLDRFGLSCFSGCSSLKEVNLPEGMSRIYDSNFAGCVSLEVINIPSTVTFIGGNAFGGCAKIKKLEIPEAVEKIVAGALSGCTGLEYLKVPFLGLERNDNLGLKAMFNNIPKSLKKLVLGDNLEKIHENAFNGCSVIEEITFGANLKTIDTTSFTYLTSLKALYYNGKVVPSFTYIGTPLTREIMPLLKS